MADTHTLYKLIILSMLRKANFPLSNPQLSAFFEQNEFTDYTAFQETVQALLEANLITSESIHNIFHYELTKEGNEVLFYFMNEIPKETEEKIDDYIRNNRFQLHNETGVTADYYKTPNFDYNVHLKVREGKTILFELNVSVPTLDEAEALTASLERNAQNIYAYVMKTIL